MRPTRSRVFGHSNAVARPNRLGDRHPRIAVLWRETPTISAAFWRVKPQCNSQIVHILSRTWRFGWLVRSSLTIRCSSSVSWIRVQSHRPPPCGATRQNDLLANPNTDIPKSFERENVSFNPRRSILSSTPSTVQQTGRLMACSFPLDFIRNKDFATVSVAACGSEHEDCVIHKPLPWPNPRPRLWCSVRHLSQCGSVSRRRGHARH